MKEIHVGDKQGLLTVLKKDSGHSRWVCHCKGCGRVRTQSNTRLKDGATECERCEADKARFQAAA